MKSFNIQSVNDSWSKEYVVVIIINYGSKLVLDATDDDVYEKRGLAFRECFQEKSNQSH